MKTTQKTMKKSKNAKIHFFRLKKIIKNYFLAKILTKNIYGHELLIHFYKKMRAGILMILLVRKCLCVSISRRELSIICLLILDD